MISEEFIKALAREIHNDQHGPMSWDSGKTGNPEYWYRRVAQAIKRAETEVMADANNAEPLKGPYSDHDGFGPHVHQKDAEGASADLKTASSGNPEQ